ncbi:MAG TPA: DUF983 domain-containing protein [Sphingopyxis sp.]|nr:DUF983 domain-containing protein [Sphingopyxis sp.]
MYGAAGAHRLPRTKECEYGQPGFFSAAHHGLCPRCGAQSVFEGLVHFHPRCAGCGLDFSRSEAGGRFAAIITFLFAALLIGLAMALDEMADPPLWLQLAIWAPLTAVGVIYVVRFSKAGLLMLRYMKAQQRG